MHPLFAKASSLTESIIGAAIEPGCITIFLVRRIRPDKSGATSSRFAPTKSARQGACVTPPGVMHAGEVHRDKGPGLVESIYEWCLLRELELRRISVVNQKVVRVTYKGFIRDEPLRCDILVEGSVLIEVKAVGTVLPIHKAQLLSYMRLLDVPLGLLINFNVCRLTDGISRLILDRADLQVPLCVRPLRSLRSPVSPNWS